jgi:hypothetical protein
MMQGSTHRIHMGNPTMTPRDVVTHDEVMTGTFHDRESAEAAYQDLIRRGYKPEEIHLIMSEDTRKRYYADTPEIGSKAASGGMAGATVGGAVGAVAAVLAAAGTLAIPGLGVAGLGAGGAAGGIIGALIGAGIPEERARLYKSDIEKGGIVVGVRPRSVEDVTYFENAWKNAEFRKPL